VWEVQYAPGLAEATRRANDLVRNRDEI